MATVALLVTLWGVLPVGLWLTRDILREHPGAAGMALLEEDDQPSWLDLAIGSGPVVQSLVAADGTTEEPNDPRPYDWGWTKADAGETAARLASWAAVYVAAGGLLLWRAKARFRRDVF